MLAVFFVGNTQESRCEVTDRCMCVELGFRWTEVGR